MSSSDSPPPLATILLDLCARVPSGSTISPIDAAKAFAEACGDDELAWRLHLSAVRRAAIRLAQEGQLVIYRKGKVADPNDFRGVYRLGAPRQD